MLYLRLHVRIKLENSEARFDITLWEQAVQLML